MLKSIIDQFITNNKLPAEYKVNVERWFLPLAETLVSQQQVLGRPLIVGINGAQGSGKSTLSALLESLFIEHYSLHAITLSIDDFYLTLKERESLGSRVHPLLTVRGVPGTHDIPLAMKTITSLVYGEMETEIPRFNKASDDRYEKEHWGLIDGQVDIMLLEGWCVGAEPQDSSELLNPVNELEIEQDSDGIWRQYVNQQLHNSYGELFKLIDSWVMLKAPSFDVVYSWRLEQEHKLRASQAASQKIMTDDEVSQFIRLYQRITEHVLKTLPHKVNFLFDLDSERKITKLTQQ